MGRLVGWERRLSGLVDAWRHRPYAYGTADCACFARAAVVALTGRDPLPGIVPPQGWLGAARFMLERGYSDVEDMASKLIGPPLGRTAFAGRGDLVSFETTGERHLAVCLGSSAASPGETGLVFLPPPLWLKAWKVG